jgi:orotate phosphoribosyltransferase
VLFGPAYKGIPLAAATAAALFEHHGRNVPYAFNRKEAKDHGEGGSVIGAPLRGRVLVIDDVVTAGTAVRESLSLIRQQGGQPAGVIFALDRQERGQGTLSATQEIEKEHGIPCVSVVTLGDLIEALSHGRDGRAAISDDQLTMLKAYRQRYGVS